MRAFAVRPARIRAGIGFASPILAVVIALAIARPAAAEGLPELPRGDVVAAYYLGFAAGPVALERRSSVKADAGAGAALGLSLGVAFWHEFPVNVGFGILAFDDKQPFTEFVVTCTTYGNADLGCSDPEAQESSVSGSYVSVDAGYERRFQLSDSVALVPAALGGYLWGSRLERGVGCDGCRSIPIPGVKPHGAYLAAALRFVFTTEQFFAISARYQQFLSGDIRYMPLFGFEFLAP